MNWDDVMGAHQNAVCQRVLDEESARRRHLVISLSGAHAYGFPSVDSDLDLKGIHIEKTDALLGLHPPPLAFDRLEIIEGVEIDYTANEIQPVIRGFLSGNGNYFERVLGVMGVRTDPLLASLQPLAAAALSKKVYRHYQGFAKSQLHAYDDAGSVKKALYVLRTALTGTHLLATGRMVIDVRELLDEHGFAAAQELIERKKAKERGQLDEHERAHWRKELERAFSVLDSAHDHSTLPAEAKNEGDLERWLLEVRR